MIDNFSGIDTDVGGEGGDDSYFFLKDRSISSTS